MLSISSIRSCIYVSPYISLHRPFSTLDAGAIERLKRPTRGGQNLSLRYRRLEQSLRGKEALQREILARESDGTGDFSDASPTTQNSQPNRYFLGLEIPQEPKPPESDECCMSGCAVCVYDLYEESLGAYKESLATLGVKLTAAKIPESEWPKSVRSGQAAESKKPVSVSLSAFEELERSLKAKREATTQ
ncbi:hypothetical protein B0H19DRAFT_1255349 [Mycena capillaripes]|nr:hypothetical protein B0H19DRAFT_1255349 [Mycena capillaripes]